MKRVLVLGGSGALGRVVCRGLIDAGARVALTWWRGEAAAEALRGEVAAAVQVDLGGEGVEAAVDEAAEALGGLDALVHSAAIGIRPGLTPPGDRHQVMREVTLEDWEAMMNLNVRSAFLACRRASEIMRAQREGAASIEGGSSGGDLILVGSIDGVKPVPSPVHYAASKAALGGMARAMAKELGRENIRVNVVAPGMMDRGLSQIAPAALVREYEKHSGLRRRSAPEEVASVVCWLALSNTYLTGETIAVDGGL